MFPNVPQCSPNVLQCSPNVLQMFSCVLQMFSKCCPHVLQMLSLCKDNVEYHCWCARGPENIAVGERSQAFIQLKPCQHPHHLPDIVSGMLLPIACNCSIAIRSGTCLAAHSGMQLIFVSWAVATRDIDVKQRRATPLSDRTKP
jgi:hypothetical protein